MDQDDWPRFWDSIAEMRLRAIMNGISVPGLASEAADNIRQQIDGEMAAILHALLPYRLARNTLSPISRLPPDVLCKVFAHAALADPPSRTQVQLHTELGWIKVTHVCHSWRELALAEPSLWADVPNVSLEWMREMLLRLAGKAVPICLTIGHEGSKAARISDMLLDPLKACSSQLRNLVLLGTDEVVSSFLESINNLQSSLTLESIQFASCNTGLSLGLMTSASRILQMTNPQTLRRLAIHDDILLHDVPQLPNLRDFELVQSLDSHRSNDPSSKRRLLRTLFHMPRLETLTIKTTPVLDEALVHDNDSTESDRPPNVSLTNLQKLLAITYSTGGLVALMSNISLSRATTVTFGIKVVNNSDRDRYFNGEDNPVFNWLRPLTSNAGIPEPFEPLRAISISLCGDTGRSILDLKGRTTTNQSGLPKITIELSGEGSYIRALWPLMVGKFCQVLQAEDVRSLALLGVLEDSIQFHQSLYNLMSNVTELTFGDKQTPRACQLQALTSRSLEIGSEIPMPKLQKISMRRDTLDSIAKDGEEESCLDLLKSILEDRRKHLGSPLPELNLLCSGGPPWITGRSLADAGLVSRIKYYYRKALDLNLPLKIRGRVDLRKRPKSM